MPTHTLIPTLLSLAAFWHVVGFAFGFVYVRFAFLSLFGNMPYDRENSRILRTADLHLWLSGLVLIGLGMLDQGAVLYLSNPKLWGKLTVVLVWMCSTQAMRHFGLPAWKQGRPELMFQCCVTNIACWMYGAMLGGAHMLADGVVSYAEFMFGFLCVLSLVYFWLRRKTVHRADALTAGR